MLGYGAASSVATAIPAGEPSPPDRPVVGLPEDVYQAGTALAVP